MRLLPLRLLGALLFSLVTLLGCSSVPIATDGEALRPGQGLLVFHVSSNADAHLSFQDFAETSTFGSRFAENMVGPKGAFSIRAGERYYVVPLRAGEYMWSRFDAYPRFAWLQGNNRFKVQANSITYIGHIRVKVVDSRFTLQALDREVDMRAHLLEQYPSYFQSMPLQKSLAQLRLR